MRHLNLSVIFSLCAILFSINSYSQPVEKFTPATSVPVTVTTATGITPPTTLPAPAPSSIRGQPIIITPVPAAKEVVPTPKGYINCFTVEAGWYKNAWVPAHKICQYDQAATSGQTVTYQGVAWIEGYWACTQYTDTSCTKWEWRSGRWVKTLEVY